LSGILTNNMKIAEIGEILLKKGKVTREQLDFCLMIQKQTKGKEKIGRIMKYYNFVSDDDIGMALAEQVGWRFFTVEYVPHLPAVEVLGLDFIKNRTCLPVETEKGVAFVFVHPFDTETTDILNEKGYGDKEFYIGSEGTIFFYIDSLINQRNRKDIDQKIKAIKTDGIVGNELLELLDQLLDDAIALRATDIHIEPGEKICAVRFRIDGILYHKVCLPKEIHDNLVNVVFNKAGINISDFLRFHDGRFQHQYLNHQVDIRISCIPSSCGAAVVMRLLDIGKVVMDLNKLGFNQKHMQAIWKATEQPYGITIITGPTGSGKTTTLYALLNYIKSLSTKIVTIEDPIEIKMPLVNQVQINEKQGITFASAVRSFLRHDPDVILIGEIRDTETAIEACRAAITGHKVFSTLHTNTAADCVYRLMDLGVDIAHIANSVNCVVSQRLIRKLCGFCRRKAVLSYNELPEVKRKYFEAAGEKVTVYTPNGCERCQDGYRGRAIIAETLYFNDIVRSRIARKDLNVLREIAQDKDYITLQRDAARLIKCGDISLEEALRVVG